MFFSRRALLGQFSAATLLAAGGCSQAKSGAAAPLRVATAAGSFNTTMSALMKQQKYFELFGVNPEIIATADGSKILAGVVSNSIEIVPMSGFGQVFPAIERGAGLKLISASTLTPLLALFSSKGNVKTLKDIEGKVVGTGALGSLLHQLAVALLLKHNVDVSKVRFLNVGSNTDVFRGVMAGTVDAGAGPASYIPDAEQQYKVHLIENGDMSVELREFTYQGGWTSARAIEQQRDQLVRVLAAYGKLFRFIEEPSSRDAFLQARRTAFPSSEEKEHVSEWEFLQRTKPLSQDLILSPERVRYMQQINLDFKVQKEMQPYEKVVDPTLAQDAIKLIGAT